ncbi:MAG: peptidoglycan DD-metalloendopeptidase family protein [Caldilineales bacterium]
MRPGRAIWLLVALLTLLVLASCGRPTPRRLSARRPPRSRRRRPPAGPPRRRQHTPPPLAHCNAQPDADAHGYGSPDRVSDAVRPPAASPPVPQEGAPCGLVDTLDFPVAPPLAEQAYLIQGFGRGGRPAGQHAGEDWGLLGRPNLGAPVYAIGHGRVTYAQPLGWGRDKGVIIVEHRFADGSRILSFYGHLDPPSVTLRAGDCVERSQEIARIGQPRTPPHLHFEMRSHLPDEPGPGYWPNPSAAGWTNPSQYIWNERMAGSPGVAWSRPLNGAALADAGAPLVIDDESVTALEPATGAASWRLPVDEGVAGATRSADGSTLYVLDTAGVLSAYDLPDPSAARWQLALAVDEDTTLAPLADGGVLVSTWGINFEEREGTWELLGRRQMTAVSAEGEVVWERTRPAPLYWQPRDDHWVLAGSELILAASGSDARVWSIDREGPAEWTVDVSPRFTVIDDQLWGFDANTIYRLQPDSREVEIVAQLAPAAPGIEAILPLPDGRILLAHRDRADRRLMLLDGSGAQLWDRSYASLAAGSSDLLRSGTQTVMLTQNTSRAGTRVDLYTVDLEDASLRHIFAGGGPVSATPASAWRADDGRLLLAIPGGSLLALDLAPAQQ